MSTCAFSSPWFLNKNKIAAGICRYQDPNTMNDDDDDFHEYQNGTGFCQYSQLPKSVLFSFPYNNKNRHWKSRIQTCQRSNQMILVLILIFLLPTEHYCAWLMTARLLPKKFRNSSPIIITQLMQYFGWTEKSQKLIFLSKYVFKTINEDIFQI